MRTPAFAIAWQLWTRHRGGIVAALGAMAAMVAVSPLLPIAARMIISSIVLVLVTSYFMNILLFATEVGNLLSPYPRRMYALPLPSRTLVAWPMLYGGGVVALLWVAAAYLVYRPSGFQTPVLLPALGLAAALVWLQAFTWSPIRFPVLHLVLGLSFIPLLIALPLWSLWFGWASQPVVAVYALANIAAAHAMARAGIASDRRGDTWHVLPTWTPAALAGSPLTRSRRPFHSPGEAQIWYEWDCHGLVFPLSSAALVFLMFTPDLWARRTSADGFRLLIAVPLIMPALVAATISIPIGSPRPSGVASRSFITFLATRPMTSGALVAAKFLMAARSVLLMYELVGLGTMLWIRVVVPYYTGYAWELWQSFLISFLGWKAPVVLALSVVTVPVLTWGLLTAGFVITFTGRHRLVVLFNLAVVAGAMSLGVAVLAYNRFGEYPAQFFWMAVPWLVGAAATAKLIVATWAFSACLRRGLMRTPIALGILAAALALNACAVALAALLLPSEGLPGSPSVILLGIATCVPLARFPLAPLALEWNRHR